MTDYQQYDDLMNLMRSKLMITQAYGNQAPQLLPPFTLDLIRHRFGLDGEGYGVQEEMSDSLMAVVRAQQKAESGMRNGVKQLPVESEASGVRRGASGNEQKAEGDKQSAENSQRQEPELTDEELEVIRLEQENYGAMYEGGKVPS